MLADAISTSIVEGSSSSWHILSNVTNTGIYFDALINQVNASTDIGNPDTVEDSYCNAMQI